MKKIFYILLTAVFSLTGYFSIVSLINKPDLPFEYYSNSTGIYAEDTNKIINRILKVDDIFVYSDLQLEFVIDRYKAGQTINLTYIDFSGKENLSPVTLVRNYESPSFIWISSFIGFVFLLMAFFAAFKKTGNTQALMLFWVLSLFGLATLSSPGHFNTNYDWLSYIIRSIHAISYTLGSLFFVLFIISFPVNRLKEKKVLVIIFSALAALVAAFSVISQYLSIKNNTNGVIFEYSWVCVLVYLVFALVTGSYFFIKDLKTAKNKEERKKREWILWGLTAGVSPYLILWVIPRITGIKTIINEQYLLLFLITIPVSLVISVIKYQVLEIELVVKRSFVYSILSLIIIGIYIGVLYLSNIFFDYILGSETRFINLLAVLIAALSFNPLRSRLNNFADKIFYKEKYRFDQTLINFSGGVKEFSDLNNLSRFVLEYIIKIIPVTNIAVAFWINDKTNANVFTLASSGNFYSLLNDPDFKGLLLYSSVPVARTNCIDRDIGYVGTASEILKKHDISICIPLMLGRNNIIGSILIGEKLSGFRFSWLDIELLTALADAFATEVDRIMLHEKVAAEELELAKLEELNKLKSFYVASVSHDLKTPLTSIKVFTELMLSEKRISIEKRNEYLKIIEGETDRLSRLIENVLDFAKIEKGIKQYSFSPVDMNNILKSVIKAIEYTLKINKFKLRVNLTSEGININGDSDALKSAIFNIIANSIKYSQDSKCLEIISGIQNNRAFIEISDKGIGIPQSDQNRIFDPFFRGGTSETNRIKGAGLGLTIVKHVMDAHKGFIELISKINEGTKIRLIFPISKNE